MSIQGILHILKSVKQEGREQYKEDLMANWKLAVEGQQPHKIEPLR